MAAGVDGKMGKVTATNKEFHEGEPVFVIRAQDPLAEGAITAYAVMAKQKGCDEKHVQAAREQARIVSDWQIQNMDKVKELPDS